MYNYTLSLIKLAAEMKHELSACILVSTLSCTVYPAKVGIKGMHSVCVSSQLLVLELLLEFLYNNADN